MSSALMRNQRVDNLCHHCTGQPSRRIDLSRSLTFLLTSVFLASSTVLPAESLTSSVFFEAVSAADDADFFTFSTASPGFWPSTVSLAASAALASFSPAEDSTCFDRMPSYRQEPHLAARMPDPGDLGTRNASKGGANARQVGRSCLKVQMTERHTCC